MSLMQASEGVMTPVEPFLEHRSLLFSIAYRMLGSTMDAEDIVQETYLRWQATDHGEIENPRAFLATVASRLCIDHLRSARARREQYVGPWLPEPVLSERVTTPAEKVATRDTLSMAFMLMLERLSPYQRAALVLHDVFGYGYEEVADILQKTPVNCRQLVSRARRTMKSSSAVRPQGMDDMRKQEATTRRFATACFQGDVDELMRLLAPDVVMRSDGGGKEAAALRPVEGHEKVSRFFLGITRQMPSSWTTGYLSLNGQVAFAVYDDQGKVDSVALPHIAGGRILQINVIRNPDKLRGVPSRQEASS